jgi:6-phosphogluconolactonase (cycloisomerase 2 family)
MSSEWMKDAVLQATTRRQFVKGATAAALAGAMHGVAQQSAERKIFAYVGTYTTKMDGGGNGEGIFLFELNPRTGELLNRKLAAKTPNPSWIAIHPSRKYLYAINEVTTFEGGSGSVTAFGVDETTGALHELNVVSSQGAGPAHMSLDATGRFAFVANYAGGSIAVLPVLADGRLGDAVDTHRDTDAISGKSATNAPLGSFAHSGHDKPHAHMIAPDPQNRFVLQSDLGQDRIYVYRFDAATGTLTPAATPYTSLPSGDGPRHFAFHPNGHWLYLLQEEASTVVLFHFDQQNGGLTEKQTLSTLPSGFAGTSYTSEILVSKDGRFVYCVNRLHDTIAIFAVGGGGMLHPLGEVSTMGDYPRHFSIAPGGEFLYVCNQLSDSIATFRIDHGTGQLKFTGQYTAVGSPAILTFL